MHFLPDVNNAESSDVRPDTEPAVARDGDANWLPILDAFRIFCLLPGSDGKEMYLQIQQVAALPIGKTSWVADEL